MTFLAIVTAALLGLIVYDLLQRRHAILRNFPIIGHFRYWLESVGPELRPGTDNELEGQENYLIVKHETLGPAESTPIHAPDPPAVLAACTILAKGE